MNQQNPHSLQWLPSFFLSLGIPEIIFSFNNRRKASNLLARASSGAVVGWLRKSLLHSLPLPSSSALLGPNLPPERTRLLIRIFQKDATVSLKDEHNAAILVFSRALVWSSLLIGFVSFLPLSFVICITKGAKSDAVVLGGKSLARDVKQKVAEEIGRIKSTIGKSPKLAVFLVGDRRDSQTFVHIKLKACEQVGIETSVALLLENCEEKELVDVAANFNKDPAVHDIIVQLPLPQHLDEENVINFVSPEKDVDGFHPINMGNLAMRGRKPFFIPCASMGCIELLLRHGVEFGGKRAVVIGRRKIAVLPTSLLLQRYHATVGMEHAFAVKPEWITFEADIVVADVGIPNMICGTWLKQGAVVIDMGTNQVKNPDKEGFRVIGDVCYEEAIKVASALTPLPGGLGPVTMSILLSTTLDAAKRALGSFESIPRCKLYVVSGPVRGYSKPCKQTKAM